jgi:hypothetical protein
VRSREALRLDPGVCHYWQRSHHLVVAGASEKRLDHAIEHDVAWQLHPRMGQRYEVRRVRDHAVYQAGAVDLQMFQDILGRPGVTLLRVTPARPGAPLPTGCHLNLLGRMEEFAADALKSGGERRSPGRAQSGQAGTRAAFEIDACAFVLIGSLAHFCLVLQHEPGQR